jgi:L-asparagine transporter-like permease
VILLVRQNFETIVAGMTFAVLIFYALATVALFRLRRRGVGSGDIFKVPFYPVLPGIYLAGILLLVILRLVFEFEKSLVDLCFILSGLPVAWYWCRKPASQKR